MAGLPGGTNRQRSTTHGKPPFSSIGMQKKGGFKAKITPATGSSGKSNCERNINTITGSMPHFASFAPRDWESSHDAEATKHPYASSNGEEKDAELPTFVSYVYNPFALALSFPSSPASRLLPPASRLPPPH
jgi:hypothetical protein